MRAGEGCCCCCCCWLLLSPSRDKRDRRREPRGETDRWLLLPLALLPVLPLLLLFPAAPPVTALAIAMREGDRREGEGEGDALSGDEGANEASEVMQRRMPADPVVEE